MREPLGDRVSPLRPSIARHRRRPGAPYCKNATARMAHLRPPATKGILHPREGRRRFALSRAVAVRPSWTVLVERHWMVEWDLGARPYTQELLNAPDRQPGRRGRARGACTASAPRATGARSTARPGGRREVPARRVPAVARALASHTLTNRVLPLDRGVRPTAGGGRGARPRRGGAPFAVMEAFLRARTPPPDPNLDVLAAIVRTMLEDPAVAGSTSSPRGTGCPSARSSGCSAATSA